ncbi:MAG: iron ABC transporter permease [Lentisphaerae bacterium]|nr:iron ABC transporter permease [Lentisphaerota bacterium]
MNTHLFFRYLLLAAVLLFLGVFLLLPIGTVVGVGCDWQLIAEIFRNRIYLEGLWNSFAIAVCTTGIVFILSLILALLYDRCDFPGKNLSSTALLIPMVLPPFVGALGFKQILGYHGVINALLGHLGLAPIDFLGGSGQFWAICVIEALHLFPICYLNLVTALGNIDPAMNEAAANLGASPWQRFLRIRLPLMRSGILAGCSITLIWSFTELGTPLMFGFTRTTAVQIFNGLTELESNPIPYALVVIMLVVSAALYLTAKLALRSTPAATSGKGMVNSGAQKLSGWKKFLPGGVFGLVTLLAGLPHLALIFCAFSTRYSGTVFPENFTLENFDLALSNVLVLPSIANSLKYSFLAMLIACFTGLLVSLAAVRWRLKGSGIADLLAMLPLAVPGVVFAFGFLGMAVKFTWASTIFDPVNNPVWLLSIAYAVRRIPYVVRAVSSGLEQTPEELENAARNFGASSFKTLCRITLPLVTANLIVGGLFAFSFSMLEVSDSLILAQKQEFFPITRALFELSQILGFGTGAACAFGVWAMFFLGGTLCAGALLLGKKIGAVFKF